MIVTGRAYSSQVRDRIDWLEIAHAGPGECRFSRGFGGSFCVELRLGGTVVSAVGGGSSGGGGGGGTSNHGSLSDRIMNRFGDTPAGMVESALEFVRIAEGASELRDNRRGAAEILASPADALQALLSAILAKPRLALVMGKQLFYQQAEMGIAAAYQLAGETMACNMMDDAALEGVQAFIDKRTPNWTGVSR